MVGAISQDRESCQFPFLLDENPLLYRSAWLESSREASERFLKETLGRTQSERRRRLALAGGFRVLRLFGIERLDVPARPARERPRLGTRWQAMPERERFYRATSRWGPTRRG